MIHLFGAAHVHRALCCGYRVQEGKVGEAREVLKGCLEFRHLCVSELGKLGR